MPRQNTSPADFPPAILAQIEQLAQCLVATRKSRGETQAQWAERLGISQPTMARLERGDASVAMATYVACLWQINPALDLTQLIAAQPVPAKAARLAPALASTIETGRIDGGTVPQSPDIAQRFSALKSALDDFDLQAA